MSQIAYYRTRHIMTLLTFMLIFWLVRKLVIRIRSLYDSVSFTVLLRRLLDNIEYTSFVTLYIGIIMDDHMSLWKNTHSSTKSYRCTFTDNPNTRLDNRIDFWIRGNEFTVS
jgi:hypothetical protein